jgi:hypothetical protein
MVHAGTLTNPVANLPANGATGPATANS